MPRLFRAPPRHAAAAAATLALFAPAVASAQATPLPTTIEVGAWSFRPLIELRVRGEYRSDPVDTGGDAPSSTAALSPEDGSVPVAALRPSVRDAWGVTERARLGLSATRGPVTAAVTLQDARAFRSFEADSIRAPEEAALPSFGPYEAYIEVRSQEGKTMFLRAGRQAIAWGDGRLVGESDWSATPRSFDALRFFKEVGDFDIEAFAAMLAAPGTTEVLREPTGPSVVTPAPEARKGTGAQLYGLRGAWHVLPLLQAELTGLARVVRDPVPTSLAAGDTFVIDARVSGEQRGFRYAVEGAYELGRIATVSEPRSLSAFAAAARAELETALPWHLTFGAKAAYASGDDAPLDAGETSRAFDPIAPDVHENHGAMGLHAWSNLIEAGAHIAARPSERTRLRLAYQLDAMAEPHGRWTTSSLFPVGSAAESDARLLGHEIDLSFGVDPWDPLQIEAGYGLLIVGDAAKAILDDAGRASSDLQHWAFLQATVKAP